MARILPSTLSIFAVVAANSSLICVPCPASVSNCALCANKAIILAIMASIRAVDTGSDMPTGCAGKRAFRTP